MKEFQDVDVIIIGAGPSGMSTALHLNKIDQRWKTRMIVIDKSFFPREKLCGGGVTYNADKILDSLGLTYCLEKVPINEIRYIFQDNQRTKKGSHLFYTVRRLEFDNWLVDVGKKRGIVINQGQEAIAVNQKPEYIQVVTQDTIYSARVVVAADGSRSLTRRQLDWEGFSKSGFAFSIITPESQDRSLAFRNGLAVFDFSMMARGLQGYYWDFPSLIDGKPYMNRGIGTSLLYKEFSEVSVKKLFEESLIKRGVRLGEFDLHGQSSCLFDINNRLSKPRILLAGDAAGIDPLFGEGISFALAYGDLVSNQVVEAFSKDDFSMKHYDKKLKSHPILKNLISRSDRARFYYGLTKYPWFLERLWESKRGLFI